MDLVDEQNVSLIQRGEDRRQVAGPLDGRPGRVADVDAELAGDDRRELGVNVRYTSGPKGGPTGSP